MEKRDLKWLELRFSEGLVLPPDMDALPTLSDGFWSQNSGLPGDGKRCGSPGDFTFKPSTRLMPSLLLLLG